MIKLNLLIVCTFLSLITITNAQWIDRSGNLPAAAGNGWAIDAVDSSNAVISTNAGFFKTSDGGGTWLWSNSPGWAVDVSMKSTNDIWIGGDSGRLQYTSNGGTSWVTQYYDPTKTEFINYIEMFDMNNGIAMGDAVLSSQIPIFLKTTDGGANWVSVNDSAIGGWSGDIWRRIDFIDLNTGYFYESGVNPQGMFKTTDGCQNWQRTTFPTSGLPMVKSFDENIVIVGLFTGPQNIHRSLDGGTTWELFTYSPSNYVEDIEFLPGDASKIWLADGLNLFFSSDTGKTWTMQEVSGVDSLHSRDLVFVDNQCGWLLCDGGKVYRTTNGSTITSIVGNQNLISDFSLEQNYPNPFNPVTKIQFSLKNRQHVTLRIYNILGREILALVNEEKSEGSHEINFDGSYLSSGIYVYKIQAGEFVSTKKMTLLK